MKADAVLTPPAPPKIRSGAKNFRRRNSLPPRNEKEGEPNSGGAGVGSGDGGGQIVAVGTPEEVAQCERSYTGQYLKRMLS